jgi:NhaC family Na+:H+ antiporter
MATLKPMTTRKEIKPPSLFDALAPVITLAIFLIAAMVLYGDSAIGGPIQIALILSTMVAMLIGIKNGYTYEGIGRAAVQGVTTAMGAIFILFAVGSLIGTWAMSGTVATLIYYGVQFLNPKWFYPVTVLICAVLALSIGSSWTVVGTLGVGLMGIAAVFGLSPAVTAGAVISGAYFGDKMSPLSETTNLAPAVAGTDLYTHIKTMLWTTIPSILIALVIYVVLGLLTHATAAPVEIISEEGVVATTFNISIWTLIPLVVVVLLALRKVPPFATILIGALLGGLMAIILQPNLVAQFGGYPDIGKPAAMLKGVWSALATGFVLETGVPAVDDLFSRGGMGSMLGTVWLIMSAMAFGGVMEFSGLLARMIDPLVDKTKSAGALLITVGLTAIGVNIVAGDQYMAIVLPGRMFRAEVKKRGIAPQVLSRQIEDTATITSPLVPWNSCGAYMSATLGITTFAYLPFTFFNLINPIVSFIYDIVGFQVIKLDPEKPEVELAEEVTMHGVGGFEVDEMAVAADGALMKADKVVKTSVKGT